MTQYMNLNNVNRLEIIDENGRRYVNMNCTPQLQLQDNEKTLKIFVTTHG